MKYLAASTVLKTSVWSQVFIYLSVSLAGAPGEVLIGFDPLFLSKWHRNVLAPSKGTQDVSLKINPGHNIQEKIMSVRAEVRNIDY